MQEAAMIDFQSVPKPERKLASAWEIVFCSVARDVDEGAKEVIPVQDEREEADGDQHRAG